MQLELESFALFLDEDERKDKEAVISPKSRSRSRPQSSAHSRPLSPSFKPIPGKNVFKSTCDRNDIIPTITEDTLMACARPSILSSKGGKSKPRSRDPRSRQSGGGDNSHEMSLLERMQAESRGIY